MALLIAAAALAPLGACAPLMVSPGDPLNATYLIEGEAVRLRDGRAQAPAAPGSATSIRTAVFGEPVYGDLTGDAERDAGLVLVHDPGGSGTFYYVAAAVNTYGRYEGTQAVRLGDRVVIRGLRIDDGLMRVDYAVRGPGEPMSAEPAVERSRHLVVRGRRLVALEPFGGDIPVPDDSVTRGSKPGAYAP